MAFRDSLRAHQQSKKALLATNFYNAETLMGVLAAAKQLKSEIILQTSPSTLDYLGGAKLAAAMARAAADQAGVVASLHLDHATKIETIRECIAAKYDSVMIDASEQDVARNIELSCEVVKMAHDYDIAVEAELGYIPKLGQRDATSSGYTSPSEAADFVNKTGVDLLAVAIGTAHGFYKETPKLDLDRLAEIRKFVSIPLVLHGGSGLSPQQWRDAIARGIVKINFATEIKDTLMRQLRTSLLASEDIDLRKVFPPAIKAVTELVAEKLKVCSGT